MEYTYLFPTTSQSIQTASSNQTYQTQKPCPQKPQLLACKIAELLIRFA